jgi:hypothetical protein
MSRDLTYRHTINEDIKRVFAAKLDSTLPNYRLCSTGYAVKEASNATSELPIHQDWSFVDETRFESLGIWCPLTDVGKRNTKPRGMTTPTAYRELFSSIDDAYFTYLEMLAGQALLFSQRLFHGSQSNLNDQDRVAAYGILIPAESVLWFHFQDLENNPEKLEVFQVEDSFLTKYFPGASLEDESLGARSLGLIDYEFEPITRDQLVRVERDRKYHPGARFV